MERKSSERINIRKLEKLVTVLKGVAHPVRLQLVNTLLTKERTVGELSEFIGAKQSLTSQQLSLLKFSGILKSKREGNKVYYTFSNIHYKNIVASIIKELS
ncbi:ArsR/SmtB family transcription factor [Candidatus Latescibacterota bacterium]